MNASVSIYRPSSSQRVAVNHLGRCGMSSVKQTELGDGVSLKRGGCPVQA